MSAKKTTKKTSTKTGKEPAKKTTRKTSTKAVKKPVKRVAKKTSTKPEDLSAMYAPTKEYNVDDIIDQIEGTTIPEVADLDEPVSRTSKNAELYEDDNLDIKPPIEEDFSAEEDVIIEEDEIAPTEEDEEPEVEEQIIEETIVEEPISEKIEEEVYSKAYVGIKTRITIFCAALVLFIILGIVFILLGINNTTQHQFAFTEKSSLDFEVCYIENEFFDDECLPKNRTYVAGLIDVINANFTYDFNGSDLFNFVYTYSIIAQVIAHERGQPNSILFEKEEELKTERVVVENDSMGFKIDEDIKIDYTRFNGFINDFKSEHALLFDSKLIVTLHVNVEGNHPDIAEEIHANSNITMEIPLSEQTLDVVMSYQDINNEEKFHSESKNAVLDIIYYVAAGIYFLLAIGILVKFIKFLKRISGSKSPYERRLERIMREYELIIVNTKLMPDVLTGSKIYEITSFEELLDAHSVLQKPIMHTKIHNEKSCFIITNGNETYRYIMKAVDIENENKKNL